MSTSVSGHLVDDQSPAQDLANLIVVVRDESALFSSELGHAASGANVEFRVAYSADATPELGTRKLGICVFTQAHRQVYNVAKDDVAAAALPPGDITIPLALATGWTVTLGGSPNATPVRDGKAVRLFIDNGSRIADQHKHGGRPNLPREEA
jgi:hypothetical protein